MSIVTSVLGSLVGLFLPDRSYWAAKLTTGKWVCELDIRQDLLRGERLFDWSLDLIDTGDISKVTQLWIFAPPNPTIGQPIGQSDFLAIGDPGTAFQLKVASLHAFGGESRQVEGHLIGHVTNKEEGECQCLVWDASTNTLGWWESNVYCMGSWSPRVAPLGNISHRVVGLHLS